MAVLNKLVGYSRLEESVSRRTNRSTARPTTIDLFPIFTTSLLDIVVFRRHGPIPLRVSLHLVKKNTKSKSLYTRRCVIRLLNSEYYVPVHCRSISIQVGYGKTNDVRVVVSAPKIVTI